MINTLKNCKTYQERQTEPGKRKIVLGCDNKSQYYSNSFTKKAVLWGLPWPSSGGESALQHKGPWFDPWLGN